MTSEGFGQETIIYSTGGGQAGHPQEVSLTVQTGSMTSRGFYGILQVGAPPKHWLIFENNN